MQEPTFTQQIVTQVAPILVTLVAAVVTTALTMLLDMLKKKAGTDRSLGALNKISHLVEVGVLATEQKLVKELRERTADGVLTAKEASDAKDNAIAFVKSNLSEHGIKDVMTALGYKDREALDALISTHIEAAVARAKATLKRKLVASVETKGDESKSLEVTATIADADQLRKQGSV